MTRSWSWSTEILKKQIVNASLADCQLFCRTVKQRLHWRTEHNTVGPLILMNASDIRGKMPLQPVDNIVNVQRQYLPSTSATLPVQVLIKHFSKLLLRSSGGATLFNSLTLRNWPMLQHQNAQRRRRRRRGCTDVLYRRRASEAGRQRQLLELAGRTRRSARRVIASINEQHSLARHL